MSNIFVFGSNEAGRHGKGAALYAVKNHGARYGQGVGLQGNSYAIPTKDKHLAVLPLETIDTYIREFLEYAANHPEHMFMLTPIGTGLAGYSREQIYSLLAQRFVPNNILFTKEWFGL